MPEAEGYYNPNTKRWETRPVKKGKPEDTDFQDVSGPAAASERARRRMKPAEEPEPDTTDEQMDALAKRRKKKDKGM